MYAVALVCVLVGFGKVNGTNCKQGCDLTTDFCLLTNTNPMDNVHSYAYCDSVGGQLPFFYTQTQLNEFITYRNAQTGLSASVFLGYWNYNSHSITSPGNWRNNNGTGEVAEFTNWTPNVNPSNDGGHGFCAHLWTSDTWNDVPCTGFPAETICMCQYASVSVASNLDTLQTKVYSGSPLTKPLNGSIIQPSHPTINNAVTAFACDPGFILVGSEQVTCVRIGSGIDWNKPAPICKRIECDNMFDSTTGHVQAAPFYSDVDYIYTCNETFVTGISHTTSAKYECQIDGTWLPSLFDKCIATCLVQQNFDYGTTKTAGNYSGLQNRLLPQSVIEFACLKGFILIGKVMSTCQNDGSWSNPWPTCVSTGCPNDCWWWPFLVGFSIGLAIVFVLGSFLCKRNCWQRRTTSSVIRSSEIYSGKIF